MRRERGRRAEIARIAGVERQVVTNWLAGPARTDGEQALAVLEFLKGTATGIRLQTR
jgi:hypothetical protein